MHGDMKAHWEDVYGRKQPHEVSWYRPHLDRSLASIDACQLSTSARLVDVGGGASTLVDDLLERGFTDVTVLDLSQAALARSRARLGERAASVRWVEGDATAAHFEPASVDLWHDRAVLHFLTDASARDAYLAHLRRAVRPGGFVVLATFAPEGPEKCSGLPVVRYAPEALAALLGPEFELLDSASDEHHTPWGSTQAFSYVRCRRRLSPA
jgi:SAM-dependent methyltransferase